MPYCECNFQQTTKVKACALVSMAEDATLLPCMMLQSSDDGKADAKPKGTSRSLEMPAVGHQFLSPPPSCFVWRRAVAQSAGTQANACCESGPDMDQWFALDMRQGCGILLAGR